MTDVEEDVKKEDDRFALKIIPREGWHALPPKNINPLSSPIRYVFCMNTHGPACSNDLACAANLRRIQDIHMTRQNQIDIRYNFIVAGDGNVYEGRGWQTEPALPSRYQHVSNKSIVIGFVGDYNEKELPKSMLKLRENLVDFGIEKGFLPEDFLPIQIFQKYRKSQHILDGTTNQAKAGAVESLLRGVSA